MKETADGPVFARNYKVDRREKIDPHKGLREKLSQGVSQSWQTMQRGGHTGLDKAVAKNNDK